MLRIDHMPDFAEMKAEDMDSLARSRVEKWGINCEWIMGALAWGGRGDLTAFETPLFERAPGFEDFDYLRKYTPAAHKYGIQVISYLNMHWYSYPFAESTRVGNSHEHGRSLRTPEPALRQRHDPLRQLPLARLGLHHDPRGDEDGDRRRVPGRLPSSIPTAATANRCRRQFEKEYGSPIPKEDWTNPLWRTFIDFREDSLARFLADAQAAMREINPKGVIFLNAGSWNPGGSAGGPGHPEREPLPELQRRRGVLPLHRIAEPVPQPMAGKYLRAGGKPAVVFMHYMSGAWHYLLLPRTSSKAA